jgi:hypothetical protein
VRAADAGRRRRLARRALSPAVRPVLEIAGLTEWIDSARDRTDV